MSRIRVTIDSLKLPAMEPGERRALLGALESELTRALADPATREAWARSHRTPVMKLGAMALEPGAAGGRGFGARLAGAIAKGLKP